MYTFNKMMVRADCKPFCDAVPRCVHWKQGGQGTVDQEQSANHGLVVLRFLRGSAAVILRLPMPVLAFVLQNEWEYAARVLVPGIGPHLAAIEDAISDSTSSRPYSERPWIGSRRKLEPAWHIVLSGRGLGLRNPTDSAIYNYETSRNACSLLVDAIVDTPMAKPRTSTYINTLKMSDIIGPYIRSAGCRGSKM